MKPLTQVNRFLFSIMIIPVSYTHLDVYKRQAYNNASILWRCVSIDNNGPLMLADKIVDTLASVSYTHLDVYKRQIL